MPRPNTNTSEQLNSSSCPEPCLHVQGPKPSDTDCSIPVAWDLAVWAASNSIPPQLHRVAASEFTRMSR